MNKIKANDIAKFLDKELIGNNISIDKLTSINEIEPNTLSFISQFGCRDNTSKKAMIIVDKNFQIDPNSNNCYIKVDYPRLAFAKVVEKFFYEKKKPYIASSARIANGVKLGKDVYIGEHVVIENECTIGCNSIIEHNVVILKNCYVGSNCKISPGVIIGDDGLGSLKDENGNLTMLRHLGKVLIEDFVEIGANSTIARGTLNDTIIKKYTKIGPQVNIGHNTTIDENCEIAGRTHTSGSVKIGKNCFIGANCVIKDTIKIGSNCTVGIGSIVTKDVEDNATVMGLEALPLKKLVKFKKEYDYR